MAAQYILFLLIVLISEILGTLGGFGSSVFMVPLSQYFFSFQMVLALTGLMHVFSNTSKIFLFYKHIHWKTSLLIGIPGVLFVLLGAWLTTIIRFTWAEAVLGLLLIVISAGLWIKPDWKLSPTITNTITGGSIAGFLAGFVGTGGPIRGLVLAGLNLEKSVFVGTSAAVDMGIDLSRSVIYLGNGYLEKEMYYLIPFLIAASFIGSWIGKQLLDKISQEVFKKIILGLIFAIGVSLILKFWLS
ncbi:MAG: sulfite exporter TauE/SafE family protein [Bacteroidota bacterium]|jgi:uncharacterized protein